MSTVSDDWMKTLIDDWMKKGFAGGYEEARERALAEGRRQGRAEVRVAGREEGREEGGALVLRRYLRQLLVTRFGPLPGRVEERIEQSDLETLDAWFEVSLTAPSLDTIFPGEDGEATA